MASRTRSASLGATFGRDSAAHFLPGTLAVMVFLATLALAGAVLATDASRQWAREATASLTVELPPPASAGDAEDETGRVVAALRAVPGVETVTALSPAQTRALIEPWLGRGAAIPDLPLPRLIDVRLADAARVPAETLRERAAAIVPGAAVDDHATWSGPLLTLVGAVQALAVATAAIIGAAAIGTLVFVTRMRLDIHRDVIELLHIMGARDATIAFQFAIHAGRLALTGGILGAVPAGIILIGLGLVARQVETALLPHLAIGPLQWMGIMTLPVVAALLAMLTAHLTTLAALRRLP